MRHYTLYNNYNLEDNRLSRQARHLYGGMSFIEPYLKKNMRVIDLGCGTGEITDFVAGVLNNQGVVVGIDLDKRRIDDNNIKFKKDNLSFKAGDVCNSEMPSNYFDLVYTRFLLMHLDNDNIDLVLKESVRILKPGGLIVCHEGIHDAVAMLPEIKAFNLFLSKWNEIMETHGQHHSIGQTLDKYLNKYFIDVQSVTTDHIPQIDSPYFHMYISNWIDIANVVKVDCFKKHEYDEMTNKLYKLSFLKEATAIASGKKR